MKSIKVELGKSSYDVNVGPGLLDEVGNALRDFGFRGKIGIVTDANVAALYLEKVESDIKEAGFETVSVTLPPGESTKSPEVIADLYDIFLDERWERGFPIVALGGGVVGDAAGFVAATLLRGVPLIQIPTSLLAQVDSSVGGKVGINHRVGKNLIGAFYQPKSVFIDTVVLATLPQEEIYCGMAEVIKYGLILDADFAGFLAGSVKKLVELSDDGFLVEVITRCVELKAKVVAVDEKELGLRAILNFGHTFGHAVETCLGHGTVSHGEAVAFGMRSAVGISSELGMLSTEDAETALDLIRGIPLPGSIKDIKPENILETMRSDKKVRSGKIKFVLLDELGRAVAGNAVDEAIVLNSIIETQRGI